jgi:hypothetical protein
MGLTGGLQLVFGDDSPVASPIFISLVPCYHCGDIYRLSGSIEADFLREGKILRF